MTLRTEIAPTDGEVFLIFTVAIEAGRTLSTLDYRLQTGGPLLECKAMALETNNAFDLRRVVQKGPAIVKMLFACPANAVEATLVSAFHEVPLTTIPKITLIEKTPPPDEPDAAAAADATEAENKDTAAETEKDAEAEAKPETEADAKAKAEAKPEAETAKAEEEKKDTPAPAAKKAAPKTDKKPAAKPAPKPAENVWF